MNWNLEPRMVETIRRQYTENLAPYGEIGREVERVLQTCSEQERLCLEFIYGHLHHNDLVSHPVSLFLEDVRATLAMREQLPRVQALSPALFFSYVLTQRVNAEWLDGSRPWLMEQLLPLVRDCTPEQAALRVNLWCCAHATYAPTDNRTLGPFGVLAGAKGRCGEESVLLVSALRSVGLPARQVYVPRWSHCDDNHAWVEVWTGDGWHCMGACEPEPTLDRGWFPPAASRAMLVHSKVWSPWAEPGETAFETPLYALANITEHYARAVDLEVQVTRQGVPVPGAAVEFQLCNYSELYPIHRQCTDDRGRITFRTGLGDLCLWTSTEEGVLLKKVDLRRTQSVTLELTEACPAEQLPPVQELELVPPAEGAVQPLEEPTPEFQAQLARCESHREAIAAEIREKIGYFQGAGANEGELRAFLGCSPGTSAEKEQLCSTLREKDFTDITREVLEDALLGARPWQGRYDPEIFRNYILAPRVCDEMLRPERRQLQQDFGPLLHSPREILAWMDRHLQVIPDQGVRNFYPSVLGCLRSGRAPAYCLDLIFMTLCRALGFPARCHPNTGKAQWLEGTHWENRRPDPPVIPVHFCFDTPVTYGERFTLGRWEQGSFATVQGPEAPMTGEQTLWVEPGFYRILTTTRQIDGTVSARLEHREIRQEETLALTFPADETADRLREVALPGDLPQGGVRTRLEAADRGVVLFTQPGAEPTEHLFRELLAGADQWNSLNCPVTIYVPREADCRNPTLQQVRQTLQQVTISTQWDREALEGLHRLTGVGDRRLPFALSLKKGRANYACANYNVGMAQTLLNIQSLHQ